MGHVDFKVVLGIIGNITAICLFASPIPTFVKIWKKKSVGDYSSVPYVATLLNCLLWVAYGLPWVKFQLLVVSINVLGAVVELIYIALYLKNAQRKPMMKVLKMLVAVVVGYIGVLVLVLELVPDHGKRKLITGSLSAVFAVLMYASPLTVMRMVIKTRSVKYMPFLLSLFNFLNGLVWTGYAFVGGIDIFIAIPNGLGALSGVVQLMLYAFYRNATPRPEHMEELEEKEGQQMKPIAADSMYVDMENGDHRKHQSNKP